MKTLKQKIFLGIIAVVLVVFGIEIFSEYMANHSYYNTMLKNGRHWWMIIWSIVAAMIPMLYLLFTKKFKLKKFLIYLILGLLFFSFAHIGLKGAFMKEGIFVLVINTILLFALGIYFMVGSFAVGTWLDDKLLKFKEKRWEELMISFGLGLGAILFVVRLLIAINLFFSLFTWIIFLGLGVMIYLQRRSLKHYGSVIVKMFNIFHSTNLKKSWWKIMLVVLFVMSLMYYFYGFQLSFIPYSTAWDANHAYMYFPKIWSLNNGVFWGDGPGGIMPGLWHAFIAFWFSLIKPISGGFWLKGDTIAVAMNFLSGLLVLVFGLGLIKKVMGFVSQKLNTPEWTEHLGFGAGWFLLLLWLTSGMGAFLVFVDNKTDLGLMAMIILAMFSGFIFLRHIAIHRSTAKKLDKESMKYVIVSAIMFGLAALTKQTASTDIMIFAVLLVMLWINLWIGIGSGFLGLRLVTMIKPANAKDLLLDGTPLSKIFLVLALIFIVIGVLNIILQKKNKTYFNGMRNNLRYGGIWLGLIVAIILVAKGPFIMINQLKNSSFTSKGFVQGLLFTQNTQAPDVLFAQNTSGATAVAVTTSAPIKSLSLNQCKSLALTEEELEKSLKAVPSQNEDVGRYVGFGWKEFEKPQSIFRLGYGLLNLLYHKPNTCFGLDESAKVLCHYRAAVDTFDYDVLKTAAEQMPQDSEGYKLLQEGFESYKAQGLSATSTTKTQLMRDSIVALRQFYQTNSIVYVDATATTPEKIMVPYKYVVPLNVVYNRSLQNHSSYYTDIGFVWLIFFILNIVAVVYAAVLGDKKLLALSTTAIFGWAIWWIIGGGIVWYGIGLIMWTILIVTLLLKKLSEDSEDETDKFLLYFVFGLVALWGLVQFVLNFARISSQGASGPFLWYKQGAGEMNTLSDMLKPDKEVEFGYGQKDVFDLQFPHYNTVINHLQDRADEDGVMIAGTYLQYFLDNQTNITLDGMLSRFARTVSDNDSCNTYKRLQNQHLKYLVIDPNIGTVVMGEGNEALFHRFFAKRNAVTGLIEDHGAISMLVKMRKEGYVDLYYTSNLGAKYAFEMPDSVIRQAFGEGLTDDQIIFIRAQMCVTRFFPSAQSLMNFIGNAFNNRMLNGAAITDIADVYGKEIRETQVLAAAQAWINGQNTPQALQALIGELTQDERMILTQYISMYNLMKSNQQQYQVTIQNLLKQSLAGSSQIIVIELKD